jgi:hypothetical protein
MTFFTILPITTLSPEEGKVGVVDFFTLSEIIKISDELFWHI